MSTNRFILEPGRFAYCQPGVDILSADRKDYLFSSEAKVMKRLFGGSFMPNRATGNGMQDGVVYYPYSLGYIPDMIAYYDVVGETTRRGVMEIGANLDLGSQVKRNKISFNFYANRIYYVSGYNQDVIVYWAALER